MREYETLISIIVPVYGTEAYISSCIKSICEQTYKNLQIILVDDGSPDKCPEICDAFASQDKRIEVIHQQNRGVSSARNAGLLRSTGEYIMFVDSDDELYPNAVEVLLRDAKSFNADIVSALKRRCREGCAGFGMIESGKTRLYQGDDALLLSLAGDRNTNSVCAKLFKSQYVGNILFQEGKQINEDGFFLFMCFLKKPRLVQNDTIIYNYINRENSNSQQLFSEKYLSMLYFCEQKMEIIKERYPQYIKKAYNMVVRTQLQFLDVLCRTNDKKYRSLRKTPVKTVRKLYQYHDPINKHHKMLARIVAIGLYPIYKLAVRLKYYR